MSNSPLISCTNISPNKTSPRNKAVDRITIHCVVGQCTAERIGEIFQTPKRQASCNYGIGKDGRIILVVDEKDRSWCSSSGANDHRAITFEVASDTTHPYAVTDAALRAVIDLCEDICRRYGKTRLLWFGDKDTTLTYRPKDDEMVLTVHRWFAAKACPGAYLYDRHGMIAQEVTKRLEAEKAGKDEFDMDIKEARAQLTACAGTGDTPSSWAKEATEYCKKTGIFCGDGAGNYGWQQPITREAVAQIIYNVLESAGMLDKLGC